MRYGLRGVGLPFYIGVIVFVLAVFLVQGAIRSNFNIWIIAIAPVSGAVVFLILEPVYRTANYVILQESHLDSRQTVWPGEGPLRIRIPYESIAAVEIIPEEKEVKLVFHPLLSSGGYSTYEDYRVFRPKDPEKLLRDIRRRIEAAKETSSE